MSESERAAFRAVFAFLNGRLEERSTVNWALRLQPDDIVKHYALKELIDAPDGRKIGEPWRSVWRLIEESWDNPVFEDHAASTAYHAQSRLLAGDKSGSLVSMIVEAVIPRLKVEEIPELRQPIQKKSRRPRKVEDLIWTRLACNEIIDPGLLRLDRINDKSFLSSLGQALDAAVNRGLDIAQRIGWSGEGRIWRLGSLHRVYFVPEAERPTGEHEPDEFHRGIAPSVKLLHAVVTRLVDVDVSSAHEFVQRWSAMSSAVHLRLWASVSRDARVTSAMDVGLCLRNLNDQRFWDVNDYPEIAELRAKRFRELDRDEQAALITRLRKGPPRSLWPKDVDFERVKNAQIYWTIRELRRIEIAGSTLPKQDEEWLKEQIKPFQDLVQMSRVDEGFLGTKKAEWVPPNPDTRYDLISGIDRLKSLEDALSSSSRGWEDDPASRAADWVAQQGKPIQLISDFEVTPDGGAAFPNVWERFGWTHSLPSEQEEEISSRQLAQECARVLSLLKRLPTPTIHQAINGISHWFSTWKQEIVSQPEGLNIWFKLWPMAIEATNAQQPSEEEIDLNAVVKTSSDREPMDLDTLNTPAGKLVGVFLAACPNLKEKKRPFESESILRKVRTAVISAPGRSSLIARHRLIESLNYFLLADPDWAAKYLIGPLTVEDSESLSLWRAIARQPHFFDVLKIIGLEMSERANDRRLGRETRSSLVFSLVVECLYAFFEQREPAVPFSRIQQMLRSIDDEIRAYGAEAVYRFVRDVSKSREGELSPPSTAELFRSAVVPFLKEVWPQERSLATPGVSRALAELPAIIREEFSAVVDSIERFLVPFECWSMLEYGLFGEENGREKLLIINNEAKATGLLRLLDLTIGSAEGSVIPHDLADALDQIGRVAPTLKQTHEYRRLATAARRR